ncbi:HEAT repeat domain-containing protein [Tessaracoccus sp. OH4464_COT-324]|uniref:HEAT repeat domain-containing protein n=1 Tax=Tessaracoccus sp. OH4464_COT-324 TaxID=2491059 RepID=UPI001319DF44|nr:HEAT repeat domain-containing protein [Tessaracoccus sp. OH4464_COT-324]
MPDLFTALRTGATITARRHAALALGSTREPGAAAVLVERLRAERAGQVREDITWALVQHAEEAEPLLLALLDSPSAHDRFSGAHVLSKVAKPAHFDRLAPLVADQHPDVALKAYRAVANTGGAKAAPVLAAQLGVGDRWQRDALIDALSRVGEPAVGVLAGRLTDDDAAVRRHALEALAQLGERAAAAVPRVARLVADPDEEARLLAVSALGALGETARPELERVAAGEGRLARVARHFLAQTHP